MRRYPGPDQDPITAAREPNVTWIVEVRDVRMTLVNRDSRWALVRDDPRYAQLMRQMKLA